MTRNKLGKPISQRQLRVGEMIKQSLGMIFVRNEAKVPNLETKIKKIFPKKILKSRFWSVGTLFL